MNPRPRTFGAIVLILAALAATACTTARRTDTAAPIDSVTAIAGTWTGTLEFGAGAQSCTLVIEPSGRAVLQGSTLTVNGTVAAQGGKGTYSFPGRSDGTVTLYQESGKRQLRLKGNSGVFEALVAPK
jgi:hypothetical protein